ncbi:MAG: PA0069 family radical SAM protein [Methylacidiphilales bacterium]|nr:PA0069 family radical SAM protein [Candidatus Methylacidiphilales bacterium]
MQLESKLRMGRGAVRDLPNRFEKLALDLDPDVVQAAAEGDEPLPNPKTQFFEDHTESIIVKNDSPDVGFSAGINPYRGCEHGCAYCYARPYHEYLGFSAGLDFESKIMVKLHAGELLRKELSRPKYEPQVLGLSGVTDCYQPAERHFRITRTCLEVLAEFRNPVSIVTKNFLVTRDLDLLKELASFDAVHVFISITTLHADLAAKMEPRASRPVHRLRAIEMLAKAGVPVGVMVAPIIPGLNDREIPAVLEAARAAGAIEAGYTMLRLPYGVKDIFREWLQLNFPEKLERILGTVREVRGGKLNVSDFKTRMRGEGPYAEQISQMFHVFRARLGFGARIRELRTEHFRRPGDKQMMLLNVAVT